MPWFMLEILGYGAAICTTVAFAPQLVKAWRTRSTNDISLAMFLVMVAGIVLWLTYGALKHDVPLTVANATTLLLAGAILFLKVKYK